MNSIEFPKKRQMAKNQYIQIWSFSKELAVFWTITFNVYSE